MKIIAATNSRLRPVRRAAWSWSRSACRYIPRPMPPGMTSDHPYAHTGQSPVLLAYASTRPNEVTIPPGIVAPAPNDMNPTMRRVRPGRRMKSGQPFWVRSMPVSTMRRANSPTTTRTMPSAAVEPPLRDFGEYGTASTRGAGGEGGGGASEVTAGSSGARAVLGSGAAGSEGGSAVSVDSAVGSVGASVLLANMSGLPASMSDETWTMSSLALASSVDSSSGGLGARLRLLIAQTA